MQFSIVCNLFVPWKLPTRLLPPRPKNNYATSGHSNVEESKHVITASNTSVENGSQDERRPKKPRTEKTENNIQF